MQVLYQDYVLVLGLDRGNTGQPGLEGIQEGGAKELAQDMLALEGRG
jgi:hypothetical protein